MSDTSKTAVLEWAIPPQRSSYDAEVMEATLADLQERATDEKEAILKRDVSSGWTNSNKLAKALKEHGVKFRTHKEENGKFTVYARYTPEAAKSAKQAA